jgi:ABC-2 type transport system permease protein
MSFLAEVSMMTRRSLVTVLRVPAAVVPSILISAFFLLVYKASLQGIAVLPAFQGKSYLGFILPVSIVSAALGGAGVAGQSLVRDLENGYFTKLLLSPARRSALLLVLGTGFAGYTVAVALKTGNAAATQGASFLFFPLTFITATFVPEELLSGWIKAMAPYNPITYVLEAMRSLLLNGWDGTEVLKGVAAAVGLGLLTFTFAWLSLRSRTRVR